MLRTLAIRDFVIVDAIELELASGFSVFTGETGAGKSILIDALTLALGGRADASVVREGATRADITAEFSATTEGEIADWLAANAFDVEEGALMLRRVIDNSGRSKAFMKAFERPLLSITRRSISAPSSTSNAFAASQSAISPSVVAENSAVISARVAPSRTTLASARPPSASVSASINMDLPAPVSPVNTEKPEASSSSIASTITKSRMAKVRSMRVAFFGENREVLALQTKRLF